MEKELELTILESKNIKVKVNFPLYIENYYGESRTYTRVNADLSAVTISKEMDGNNIEYGIEYEEKYTFSKGEISEVLGRGAYESSEKKFVEILTEFKNYLNAI